MDDILVNGRMGKLAGYFNGDDHIQHNPQVADQVSGLDTALQAMAKTGVTMKYTKNHKILDEGNFVLSVSEGEFAGKDVAFYELFPVKAGKIAEQWDTLEAIPAKTERKNSNGKF